MLEEMMTLKQNETWNLVYLPSGKGGWFLLYTYRESESKWRFGLLKGLLGGKGHFTNLLVSIIRGILCSSEDDVCASPFHS